ncbi:MAG: histidine phosphatase family protein [Lachnospiraceae bacterium]|nr:histidine phosphatase family protein [Lachnospiraceae bacterium]
MRLYIIRHGETTWNAERKMQGHQGSDLNENGVRLARVTAEGLRKVEFDLCITSPLIRAKHTAEIIMEGRNKPILEDERLMELGFGAWEGRSVAEDRMEVPAEQFRLFRTDPFRYQPPEGGETFRQLLDRTGEFLRELIHIPEYQEKTILISAHGAAVRALLNPLYRDPSDFWQGGVPMNCSYSIVEVKNAVPCLTAADRVEYGEEEFPEYYKNWGKV